MTKSCESRRWILLAILLLFAPACDESESGGETAARPTARSLVEAAEEGGATQQAAELVHEGAQTGAVPGPELTFEAPTHDFGEVWDFDQQKTTFAFRNTGSSLLIISDTQTTCGCTVPTLDKKQYAPGESGEIKVTYQPKGTGHKTNVVTVISNSWQGGREPPEGGSQTRLKISAQVKALAVIRPAFISFRQARLGEVGRQTVAITGADPSLIVEDIKVHGEHFSARLITSEAAGAPTHGPMAAHAAIEVVLSDEAPWGENSGTLVVNCRGVADGREILRSVRARLQARVYGDIDAGVGRFNLGIVKPGRAFEKSLLLTSRSGKPFEVLEVKVEQSTAERTEAWAEPLDSGKQVGYQVYVRGVAGDAKGSVTGKILIRSDVEGEEELSLPLEGAVR